MSMFDDLDDTFEPAPDVDAVATRVSRLQLRRRLATVAVASLAAVVTIASVSYASTDRSHKRVAISANETTTSSTTDRRIRKHHTGGSAHTTTTVDTVPVTVGSSTPGGSVEPPPTTGPPVHDARDLSNVVVHFDQSTVTVRSGDRFTFGYTVTNTGSWTVFLGSPTDCTGPGIAASPPGIWPTPTEPVVTCAGWHDLRFEPQQSQHFTQTFVAGQYSGKAQLIPSPAGLIQYTPLRESTYNHLKRYSIPITITPPANPVYTATFPTHVTYAHGHDHTETFTLTNNLPFKVDMWSRSFACIRPLAATEPCGTVADIEDGEAQWSRFEVGPNETVTLTADFSGDYPPGTYHLSWGLAPLTLTVT